MSNPQRFSGDRNFDDLAHRFSERIYNSKKGQIRLSILRSDLNEWFPPSSPPSTILDAGGGFGPLSQQYATHGHTVHLCDISQKMLQLSGDSNRNIHPHHTSIQNLKLPPVDIIFCHAVLEWVENKQRFIQDLSRLLKPNGKMSLLFYNIHALRFKRLLYGEIERLLAPVETGHGKSLTPSYPCHPSKIRLLLQDNGFLIESETGIRCISDYIEKDTLNTLSIENLISAERLLSVQSPYKELARYIHIKATKS